jgi:peptidyl-prolyl cis-trans isomerase SurA
MLRKTIGIVVAWLLVQLAAQAQVIDKVIAKVDNYYILKSELEVGYLQYAGQQGAPSRCQVFEGLVINKMMLAKSDIDSVSVDDKRVDAEVASRFEEIMRRFGSDPKNLEKAYGKTVPQLKAELRGAIRDQLVAQKMQSKITEEVRITPSEVRKFFKAIPQDSLPYMPAEVEVGQIVRLGKITKNLRNEIRDRLIEYRRQVLAGEDFGKLAKTFSEDLGSARNNGDLGYAKRGQMVPPFEAAALNLKPGDMSDIVESDFGFHLIKLLDIRGAEYRAQHILLIPDFQKMDLDEPARYLDSLRTLVMRDSLKFEKAAKEYSQDKNTGDAGGWILDPQTRSARLAFDNTMETNLFFTLDTMKVGTFSRPLPYRTDENKSAMRILYYKAKHPSHLVSLETDYQRMYNAALSRKRNAAIDKWFMKAKDDVFIFVDEEFEGCEVVQTLGANKKGTPSRN